MGIPYINTALCLVIKFHNVMIYKTDYRISFSVLDIEKIKQNFIESQETNVHNIPHDLSAKWPQKGKPKASGSMGMVITPCPLQTKFYIRIPHKEEEKKNTCGLKIRTALVFLIMHLHASNHWVNQPAIYPHSNFQLYKHSRAIRAFSTYTS